MTRISASVLFTPYSKLYILTELSANDVKFISSDKKELDFSKYNSYGTVNALFLEIQPDSTNIKNDPRISKFNNYKVLCHKRELWIPFNISQKVKITILGIF